MASKFNYFTLLVTVCINILIYLNLISVVFSHRRGSKEPTEGHSNQYSSITDSLFPCLLWYIYSDHVDVSVLPTGWECSTTSCVWQGWMECSQICDSCRSRMWTLNKVQYILHLWDSKHCLDFILFWFYLILLNWELIWHAFQTALGCEQWGWGFLFKSRICAVFFSFFGLLSHLDNMNECIAACKGDLT